MQRLNNSEEGTHFRSFVYCAGAGVGRFWGGEVVKGDMEAPAGPTTEAATLKYGGQKTTLNNHHAQNIFAQSPTLPTNSKLNMCDSKYGLC